MRVRVRVRVRARDRVSGALLEFIDRRVAVVATHGLGGCGGGASKEDMDTDHSQHFFCTFHIGVCYEHTEAAAML